MKTPFRPHPPPPGRPSPPESQADENDLPASSPEPEWIAANRLTAEEQFERFALWLRITDGGHQPC